MVSSSYPVPRSARFEALRGLDGWQVVAVDSGRPLALRLSKREAKDTAENLNHAASHSRWALVRALATIE